MIAKVTIEDKNETVQMKVSTWDCSNVSTSI